MKHLKLFENSKNWSHQKIIQHKKDEKYIEDSIFEFLIEIGKCYEDFEFTSYVVGNGIILVYYTDNNGDECLYQIKDDELSDLYKFMNDKELFIDAKKYNI